ncbi:MAG: hypothetical protein ACE5NC_02950 [Anaerolineae bacterium]
MVDVSVPLLERGMAPTVADLSVGAHLVEVSAQDGVARAGEPASFVVEITVTNKRGSPLDDVTVTDRFNEELDLVFSGTDGQEEAADEVAWMPGESDQGASLVWQLGRLDPFASVSLFCGLSAGTDPDKRVAFAKPGFRRLDWGANATAALRGSPVRASGEPIGVTIVPSTQRAAASSLA